MGFTVPENGELINEVINSVSNSVVPVGATNTAVLPNPSHPAVSKRRSGEVHGTKSLAVSSETAQRTRRTRGFSNRRCRVPTTGGVAAVPRITGARRASLGTAAAVTTDVARVTHAKDIACAKTRDGGRVG